MPRSIFGQWHFLWERWCIFLAHALLQASSLRHRHRQFGYDITGLPSSRRPTSSICTGSMRACSHWVLSARYSERKARGVDHARHVASHLAVPSRHRGATSSAAVARSASICLREAFGAIWQPRCGAASRISTGRTTSSFVACSKWLAGEAKSSLLLSGQKVVSIPNPIDSRVDRPSQSSGSPHPRHPASRQAHHPLHSPAGHQSLQGHELSDGSLPAAGRTICRCATIPASPSLAAIARNWRASCPSRPSRWDT